MKKAVLYCRYSSDRQTEQSIEGQRRVCQEFASQNNIKIIKEYIDRATSGTQTETRYEFLNMIDESKKLDYDYVLVYKLDRFARNRYDSAIYKRKLRNNGKKVLSAKENITDSPEGIILEGMLEAYNEYFSAELSQKVKRGQRESFYKGKVIGSLPVGYKSDANCQIIIDESQVDFVKEIFDIYIKCGSFAETARLLNEAGYKGQRGGRFIATTVRKIINNRMYIGEHHMKGEKEVITVPRIIEMSTWDKAQEISAQSSRHLRNDGYIYEYTGYIKCGCCGGNFTGSSEDYHTGKVYRYYRCKCNKRISDIKLKAALQEAITNYLSDESIETIAKKCMAEYNKQKKTETDSACTQLNKKLVDVNKQINNIVNSIASGIDINIVKGKLDELQSQKEILERKISLSAVTEAIELNENMIIGFLSKIKNSEQAVKLLLNCIVMYEDKMVICLNLTDESQMPPLEQIEFSLNCTKGSLYTFYAKNPILLLVVKRPA